MRWILCWLLPFVAQCSLAGRRVRRELRSLSAVERDRVFVAMDTMKHTDTAEGRQRYGPAFVSYDELVAQHLTAASVPGCDEAHLGAAFATFHRAFGLKFENALLAVDPRIEALPYWDYNVEARADDPRATELWTWFGSSEGDASDDHAVKDGRFAHWRIRANATDISNTTNPYGLLRSPWNVNPSSRLTRYRYSCGSQTAFDPKLWDVCMASPLFMGWYACIDPTVHTWAHSFIGGIWDTERNVSRIECFLTNAVGVPSQWANGCYKCTEDCKRSSPTSTPAQDGCACVRSPELRCIANTLLARKTPTFGDFADPWGSPNDPIFFFHHANLDRHLMTWQQRHHNQASSYGFPKIGVPCKGHGFHDVVAEIWPFESEALVGVPSPRGSLTNAEIIAMDGTTPGSLYTYDSLDEPNVAADGAPSRRKLTDNILV